MIQFGTAGLRGPIASGENGMNTDTVALATLGIATWLGCPHPKNQDTASDVESAPKFVLGYDARHQSDRFARLAAALLAHHGIDVHLFDNLCPTPQLVFAIEAIGAQGGGIITASHNPKTDNGYKVYNANGIQIGSDEAKIIATAMADALQSFTASDKMASQAVFQGKDWGVMYQHYLNRGRIHLIGENQSNAYCQYVHQLWTLPGNPKQIRIVYTPVHGVGGVVLPSILSEAGFTQVMLEPHQSKPNGDFPTAPVPNPELPNVMSLAISYAKQEDADLVLGTDPDADRAVVALKKTDGNYQLLTGNELGALLLQLLIWQAKKQNKDLRRFAIIKSIVTDDFGAALARQNGMEVHTTLTGFKNICGLIPQIQESGKSVLMGYEESIGYAFGERLKDKDGLAACRILAGAAATLQEENLTLWSIYETLRQSLGYYVSQTLNRHLEANEMEQVITAFKSSPIERLNEAHCCCIYDVAVGEKHSRRADGRWETSSFDFPNQNLLIFEYEDGCRLALRPSGTEPKLKCYCQAHDMDEQTAISKLDCLVKAVESKLLPWQKNT